MGGDHLQAVRKSYPKYLHIFSTYSRLYSRGFLLRQLWIVKYYIKSLSNNLRNENIKTDVSREIIFQKWFILAF